MKLEEQTIYKILYNKQKDVVNWANENLSSKLFLLQTGTGKTKTSLSWLENLIGNNSNINKVLMICPACKCCDWQDETLEWQQKGCWKDFIVERLDSTKTNYERLLDNGKHIFVCSHNMFRNLIKNKKDKNWKNIWTKNTAIIFDEASALKSISSETSKTMWDISKLMGHSQAVYLTATPCSNKRSDIFMLLKLAGADFGYCDNLYMDNQSFCDYFIEYKTQKIWNQWKHQQMEIKTELGLKKDKEEEYFKLIHLFGATLTLEELKGEIPKVNHITKYIENDEAIKTSKKIKLMLLDGIKNCWDKNKLKPVEEKYQPLQPVSPTTGLMYSRQLCSGFISNKQIEGFNGWTIENPKLDALKSLLENTHENVVVFYNFQKECDDICDMVKKELPDKKVVVINGQNKYEKAKIILDTIATQNEDFVIVAHPLSAGFGVNLDEISRMEIIYSLPLSFESICQVWGRINRVTQKNPCLYYYLIVKNSVEEKIWKALQSNQSYTEKMYEKDVESENKKEG